MAWTSRPRIPRALSSLASYRVASIIAVLIASTSCKNNDVSMITVNLGGGGTGTVTSNVGGLSCPTTCETQFPAGTSIQLTATAAAGSTFVGWVGGDCEGLIQPTCSFSAVSDQTDVALFRRTTKM